MRIISGTARGTKLNTPNENMAVRPTGERVKEALFSVIQFNIKGNVLDLFAGTGQLGLEALSRGADFAIFCDNSSESIELVTSNVKKTHFESKSDIIYTDYKKYLKHDCDKKFDIVFIDPPFNHGLSDKALLYLGEDGHMLSDDGIVVLECDVNEKKPDKQGVLVLKKRYTFVNVSFLIYVRSSYNE